MDLHLIEKQVLYRGKKIQLEVHRLADQNGKEHRREIVRHPGAVVILPVLPDGQIVLIKNHRYTVGEVLIELPAGTLEKDEDPMNCAGRELLEETGFLAGRIRPIASFYSSPGVMTEKLYSFAAYDLEKKQTALEEDEEIEIMPVDFSDAIELVSTGQIKDGKTIATLLLYEKFHLTRP
jgi:ADP-ribose pyrophosphatase